MSTPSVATGGRSLGRKVLTRSLQTVLPAAVLGFAAALPAQLPPVPIPAGNPSTPDKEMLGKALFWDEQMSSTGTVACGTCHNPDGGGGDPRSAFSINPGLDAMYGTDDDIHASPGVPLNQANGTYTPHAVFGLDVQVTPRTAPAAFNAAYNPFQFWDGRATDVFKDPVTGAVVLPSGGSLETQASGPPVADGEMSSVGRTWQDVANRIAAARPLALASNVPPALDAWIGNQDYPALFNKVFGSNAVTPARILLAIGAYERTLISDQTPFDLGTMTPRQQQGFNIFGNKGNCTLCHEIPLFRDNNFHNTGVRPPAEDLGRFVVTGNPADRGAFKTPGLRNVGLRTAFMHNGTFSSLAEVIEFYDRGGDFPDNLDPSMKPLHLTVSEKVALLDFLQNALTDPRVMTKTAPFDPPTLYSQTSRVPSHFGAGAVGAGGAVPRLIAIEPPVAGNASFNLTLADGAGGAAAAVAIDLHQGFGFIKILGVPMFVAGSPAMVMLPLGALQGSGAGNGYFSGSLMIPAGAPAMSLYMQGFVLDPGAPLGLSGTDGLQATVFKPR